MKTIQKTIALSIATLTASFAFGQLGLGVTSTTQAAVNASANTAVVLQTTNAASAAARSTVNSTVIKATEVKTTVGTAVNADRKSVV